MKRPNRLALAALLAGGLLPAVVAGCSRHPLKIESARRALRYNQGSSEIMVRNPKEDVFLIVEMKDMPADVFTKVKDGKPYFTAGENRLEVHYSQAKESSSGERSILLATVAPRNTLAFTLHAGDYPGRDFTAEEEVHDSLKI